VNTFGLMDAGIHYVSGGTCIAVPSLLILVALATLAWLFWSIGRTGMGKEFNRGYGCGLQAAGSSATDGAVTIAHRRGYNEGYAKGYAKGYATGYSTRR
jgi:hypothetical protein